MKLDTEAERGIGFAAAESGKRDKRGAMKTTKGFHCSAQAQAQVQATYFLLPTGKCKPCAVNTGPSAGRVAVRMKSHEHEAEGVDGWLVTRDTALDRATARDVLGTGNLTCMPVNILRHPYIIV